MTSLFQFELLNQPFGDPALYVRLTGEKKAFLFDLGEISALKPGKVFKVTNVFVSHTHMDHFIGFDHLVRLNLARDKTIRLFGPEGIIRNVKGKLKGYTWNLVGDYPFILEVIEICAKRLKKATFQCREKFKTGTVEVIPYDGTVDAMPHYTVKALRADHKITTIIYSLEEKFHININSDRLKKLGLPSGKWLRDLKDAIWEKKPANHPVRVYSNSSVDQTIREVPLGNLKDEIVTITRGQKIVYIADCRGIEKNFKKIIPFASGADILFCEAAFLKKDQGKALERGHLTAEQAGFIAHEAGVKKLQVFHFSPRYENCPGLLYSEAEKAFKGDKQYDR